MWVASSQYASNLLKPMGGYMGTGMTPTETAPRKVRTNSC
jgi:hypothetical protein